MQTITIKGKTINLNFEPQVGSEGKPFRLSGIARDGNNWIYTFRYIDTEIFFSFIFDAKGNFVSKI